MLLLLILSALPNPDVRREHFDLIEVNVVYVETCETDAWPLEYKPIFTQVIFRRWEWDTASHEIHAWRMLQAVKDPAKMLPIEQQHKLKLLPQRNRSVMHPEYNHALGCWEMRWQDGDVHRIVTADSYVETHSVGDREIEERERWPMSFRRELLKGAK